MIPAGTPEERWWAVRAGEYVLGTLRGRDLELFEKILRHDTAMQQEVAYWEQCLTPLHERTAVIAPGEHVWPAIVARIRQEQAANDQSTSNSTANDNETGTGTGTSLPSAVDAGIVQDLHSNGLQRAGASPGRVVDAAAAHAPVQQRLNAESAGGAHGPFKLFWPAVAAVATAASLLLGTVVRQQAVQFDQQRFQLDGVSVVETDADGDVRFVIETDYENRKVRVIAVAPPRIEPGQNLQLWQALPPGQEGVRPIALLPIEPGESRSYDVSGLIENSELFGVSVEPTGAPTDDGPTGPVIAHGNFVKAGASVEGAAADNNLSPAQ